MQSARQQPKRNPMTRCYSHRHAQVLISTITTAHAAMRLARQWGRCRDDGKKRDNAVPGTTQDRAQA